MDYKTKYIKYKKKYNILKNGGSNNKLLALQSSEIRDKRIEREESEKVIKSQERRAILNAQEVYQEKEKKLQQIWHNLPGEIKNLIIKKAITNCNDLFKYRHINKELKNSIDYNIEEIYNYFRINNEGLEDLTEKFNNIKKMKISNEEKIKNNRILVINSCIYLDSEQYRNDIRFYSDNGLDTFEPILLIVDNNIALEDYMYENVNDFDQQRFYLYYYLLKKHRVIPSADIITLPHDQMTDEIREQITSYSEWFSNIHYLFWGREPTEAHDSVQASPGRGTYFPNKLIIDLIKLEKLNFPIFDLIEDIEDFVSKFSSIPFSPELFENIKKLINLNVSNRDIFDYIFNYNIDRNTIDYLLNIIENYNIPIDYALPAAYKNFSIEQIEILSNFLQNVSNQGYLKLGQGADARDSWYDPVESPEEYSAEIEKYFENDKYEYAFKIIELKVDKTNIEQIIKFTQRGFTIPEAFNTVVPS